MQEPTAEGLAVPSGIDLYNAIVTERNRVKLAEELSNAIYSKGEDVFIWCMLESKKKIELPIQLDANTKITVDVDVDDENTNVRRQLLEIQLNDEGFLRLEYDSKGKFVRQYNFGSPHKGKCSMQILDSKEFRRASFKNIIADLEKKYSVNIRITSAKDETSCYAVITESDDAKCSAITTKEYSSIECLLEEMKNVILPEYEKLADSFVKLNSLTHEARIL